jgi:hypothetical protein
MSLLIHREGLSRPPSRRGPRPSIRLVAALTSAAVLTGCWAPPVGFAGRDPADPRAPTPPVGYQSSIGTYVRQQPVEPRPWGEQNERVAPQPRAGQ